MPEFNDKTNGHAGNGRQNKYSLNERLKRYGRYIYLRIIRLRTSPHNIALGLALGVFVGALPIIPFQSVLVLALAVIFRGNKVAAFFSTFYSNVFTLAPMYYVLFLVGKFFFPFENVQFDPSKVSMSELFDAGWQVFMVMMAGGVLVGIPLGIAAYFAGYYGIKRYRVRKALRRLKRQARRR